MSAAAYLLKLAQQREYRQLAPKIQIILELNSPVLVYAANKGYGSIVKTLLEAGADLGVRDTYGWTPLIQAANKGYDSIVKMLLEAGADPNVRNNDGIRALTYASVCGYRGVVKLLKQYGATE